MPDTLCSSCSFPLHPGQRYCPSCGAATGPARGASATGGDDEGASRARVQEAVGDAFRVGALLGRGGFAEVFEAWEARLGRRVAIKVLRPDLSPTPELLERFQREARAIAAVRHPGIVEIYAVGGGPGVAWFVMPLVEGPSLRELLDREGMLPLADARRILVEAARALGAAHRAGLAHRDVKPDNILLDGPDRRVLLTDFGIAKALGDVESGLTGSGVLVGTPQYMSPEQAAGDPVDHRTDVYSWGVVAYRMIAGRLPFDASSTQAVLARILTQTPRPLRELRPDCPEDLSAVVGRALAKDPGERWADLAEAVEVLEGRKPPPSLGRRSGLEGWETAAAEEAGRREAEERAAPARRFRRQAGGAAAAWAVLTAADLGAGLGGASAWAGAALGAALALRGARLWAAGHEWRELVLPGAVPAPSGRGESGAARPTTLGGDEEDFGRHGSLVRGAVRARASILKVFAAMPHAEQQRLPGLQETVEHLAARVRHLARKVVTLEERMAEASARLEDLGAAPSETTDSRVLARAQTKVRELEAAREEAGSELRRSAALLQDVEDALTVLRRDDPARAVQEVATALASARVEAGA